MKNDQMLLWGAGAVAVWYFFIKPKSAAAPGTAIAPVVVAHLPATGASAVLPAINKIVAKILPPAVAPIKPVVVQVATPLTPKPATLIVAAPVVDDSKYMMFKNGDYPGASKVMGTYMGEDIY